MKRTGCALIVMGLPLLVLLGLVFPRYWVSPGLNRWSGPEGDLARDALILAGSFVDHPIPRLFITGLSVASVTREAGSCPPGEPGSDSPLAEYVVVVRVHTFFGIPTRHLRVRCGGHLL